MKGLIERVEAASEPFPALFFEVWQMLISSSVANDGARNRFFRLVDAGAYLDAAMLLVPEGCTTELVMQDRHSLRWKWELRDRNAVRHGSHGNTPALSLLAACLKARAV